MMSTRQRFYLSWTMMVVAAIIVISANTILESWGNHGDGSCDHFICYNYCITPKEAPVSLASWRMQTQNNMANLSTAKLSCLSWHRTSFSC